MDRLGKYREIVKRIVTKQAELAPRHGQIDSRPVFDQQGENYLLVDVGWDRTGRVYTVVLHFCLQEGKIWIERDGTESGIAYDLLAAGVPQEDIVLGFYRPERRAIVEYAVG